MTLSDDGRLSLTGVPREAFALYGSPYFDKRGELNWKFTINRRGSWSESASHVAGDAIIRVTIETTQDVPGSVTTMQFERRAGELVLWISVGDFDGVDPQRLYFSKI